MYAYTCIWTSPSQARRTWTPPGPPCRRGGRTCGERRLGRPPPKSRWWAASAAVGRFAPFHLCFSLIMIFFIISFYLSFFSSVSCLALPIFHFLYSVPLVSSSKFRFLFCVCEKLDSHSSFPFPFSCCIIFRSNRVISILHINDCLNSTRHYSLFTCMTMIVRLSPHAAAVSWPLVLQEWWRWCCSAWCAWCCACEPREAESAQGGGPATSRRLALPARGSPTTPWAPRSNRRLTRVEVLRGARTGFNTDVVRPDKPHSKTRDVIRLIIFSD